MRERGRLAVVVSRLANARPLNPDHLLHKLLAGQAGVADSAFHNYSTGPISNCLRFSPRAGDPLEKRLFVDISVPLYIKLLVLLSCVNQRTGELDPSL